jgi:hypothetical protein
VQFLRRQRGQARRCSPAQILSPVHHLCRQRRRGWTAVTHPTCRGRPPLRPTGAAQTRIRVRVRARARVRIGYRAASNCAAVRACSFIASLSCKITAACGRALSSGPHVLTGSRVFGDSCYLLLRLGNRGRQCWRLATRAECPTGSRRSAGRPADCASAACCTCGSRNPAVGSTGRRDVIQMRPRVLVPTSSCCIISCSS